LPQCPERRKLTARRKQAVKIVQSFAVQRPASAVWTFFQDVPAVAACLPGAELLGSGGDGVHRGKVAVKLGPFKAAFEGEAKVSADPLTCSGHVEGRGIDKRGGSHSRMQIDYKINDADGATKVDLDVDLTLSGPIAQFGRTGLITEAANVLIADFVRNLEARLAIAAPANTGAPSEPQPKPQARPQSTQLSVFAILLAAIRARLRTLFGRFTP
jgi:uncharacterized protein